MARLTPYLTEVTNKGTPIPALSPADVARFRSKVSEIPNEKGCLLWLAAAQSSGYGAFHIQAGGPGEGRRNYNAHRVAFFLHYGYCPTDLLIRHLCGSKLCCNPEHLAEGTTADNSFDAMSHGTHCRGETHGAVKLTERDVIEIRRRRTAGEKCVTLGAEFGVQRSTISMLCRRATWGHIL